MAKQRPLYRFLTKDKDGDKLHEIGTVWATSKPDVFSVSLDLENTGETLKFMMVPNRPKPKAQAAPAPTPPA